MDVWNRRNGENRHSQYGLPLMTTTAVTTIEWPGKSETKYKYWIYPITQTFSSGPANYAYAKEVSPGKWSPVYFGETEDMASRTLDTHHRRDCIRRNGATHVHVHSSSTSAQVRRDEEADLRQQWDPTCNRQ